MNNPISNEKRIIPSESAIHEASDAFLIFNFNFPDAASRCIPNLQNAFELLFKELLARQPEVFSNGNSYPPRVNISILIDDYILWEAYDKDAIKSLKEKRNAILHGGERNWEEKESISGTIKTCFRIVGDLYRKLGYSPDTYFAPWECRLLSGEEMTWQEHSLALANAASKIAILLPDVAVDVANKAFEIALRGLRDCWCIEGANSLPVDELLEIMRDDQEDIEYSVGLYYDDRSREPLRVMGDWNWPGLIPPRDRSQLTGDDDVKHYADEIRLIIKRYIYNASPFIKTIGNKSGNFDDSFDLFGSDNSIVYTSDHKDEPEPITKLIPFPGLVGKIYISPLPFSEYDAEERVYEEWMERNISIVVMLLSEEAARRRARRDMITFYRGVGLRGFLLPLVENEIPDVESLFRVLDGTIKYATEGKNIVIHCFDGQNRTHFFLAALYKRLMKSSGTAWREWVISNEIFYTNLLSRAQQEFLNSEIS